MRDVPKGKKGANSSTLELLSPRKTEIFARNDQSPSKPEGKYGNKDHQAAGSRLCLDELCVYHRAKRQRESLAAEMWVSLAPRSGLGHLKYTHKYIWVVFLGVGPKNDGYPFGVPFKTRRDLQKGKTAHPHVVRTCVYCVEPEI